MALGPVFAWCPSRSNSSKAPSSVGQLLRKLCHFCNRGPDAKTIPVFHNGGPTTSTSLRYIARWTLLSRAPCEELGKNSDNKGTVSVLALTAGLVSRPHGVLCLTICADASFALTCLLCITMAILPTSFQSSACPIPLLLDAKLHKHKAARESKEKSVSVSYRSPKAFYHSIGVGLPAWAFLSDSARKAIPAKLSKRKSQPQSPPRLRLGNKAKLLKSKMLLSYHTCSASNAPGEAKTGIACLPAIL